jgi:hypothetical protein
MYKFYISNSSASLTDYVEGTKNNNIAVNKARHHTRFWYLPSTFHLYTQFSSIPCHNFMSSVFSRTFNWQRSKTLPSLFWTHYSLRIWATCPAHHDSPNLLLLQYLLTCVHDEGPIDVISYIAHVLLPFQVYTFSFYIVCANLKLLLTNWLRTVALDQKSASRPHIPAILFPRHCINCLLRHCFYCVTTQAFTIAK